MAGGFLDHPADCALSSGFGRDRTGSYISSAFSSSLRLNTSYTSKPKTQSSSQSQIALFDMSSSSSSTCSKNVLARVEKSEVKEGWIPYRCLQIMWLRMIPPLLKSPHSSKDHKRRVVLTRLNYIHYHPGNLLKFCLHPSNALCDVSIP